MSNYQVFKKKHYKQIYKDIKTNSKNQVLQSNIFLKYKLMNVEPGGGDAHL